MAVSIRTLDRAGIDAMIALAAAEGWNPGPTDAACFEAADPDGFLGLFRDDETVPAAVVSLVRYDPGLAFLGLYIARPDCRGQGLGFALWQAAMDFAGERSVGLDGVIAQQANYRRSGFALAWRNVRYAGTVPASASAAGPDAAIATVGAAEVGDLLALDRACFGADRRAFLDAWVTAPGHRALVLRDGDGAVAGYGVIRPVAEGYRIGPLFATTAIGAERLLDALVAGHAGEAVILDVPETNGAAAALAKDRGWRPVFETARMYRGPVAPLPLERIFGITTFELG